MGATPSRARGWNAMPMPSRRAALSAPALPRRSMTSAAQSTKPTATQSSGWPQRPATLATPSPPTRANQRRRRSEKRHSRATASTANKAVEARSTAAGPSTSHMLLGSPAARQVGRESDQLPEGHDRHQRELQGGGRRQSTVAHVDVCEVPVQQRRRRAREAPQVRGRYEPGLAHMEQGGAQQAVGHDGHQHQHRGGDGRGALVEPRRHTSHVPPPGRAPASGPAVDRPPLHGSRQSGAGR